MSQTIDVTPEQRQELLSLLSTHLPNTEAWVYGSRAQWTSRPDSDLDMAVFATPAQARDVSALREALDESDLPFRVDLFVWDEVPESFREQIQREHVVLIATKGAAKQSVSKWSTATIGEVAEKVSMGPFGSSIKVETFVSKGVPIISGQHLHGFRLDDSPGYNFITEAHAKRLANANVRRGDVVFTHRGNIGQVAYVPDRSKFERYVVSQSQFYVRCNHSKVIPEFLAAYFKSPEGRHKLLANASQVGVPAIAQPVTYLRTIDIPLPSLSEQRAIAHIIGTLDDKIELIHRMNETLEAMAQAVFKSWFVNFEPVRAKMAGERIQFPRQVTRFFPDRLAESSMGMVPDGWQVSEIGKEVSAVGGATPSTKEPAFWTSGEHAWATPKDLSALTTPVLLNTAKKVTTTGLAAISSGLLPKGTVLMSSRAPIGYLAIAETPVAVNQGFIAMICQQRLPNLYVLFWCSENLHYIKNIAGGTTFAEISKRAFRSIPVLVPSPEVLDAFSRVVGPLYGRIARNERQVAAPSGIRDLLLPKLISGQIRVQEAEKAVAEVL